MDVLDTKTDKQLTQSVLAEVNKASNELSCAEKDVKKARSRLNFLVVVLNKMIERQEIER